MMVLKFTHDTDEGTQSMTKFIPQLLLTILFLFSILIPKSQASENLEMIGAGAKNIHALVENRDAGDSNSNGIRNDVEDYINSVTTSGTTKNQYLGLYAIYLQKLVTGSYGPSSTMYYDFQNMARASVCVDDMNLIAVVGGMTMDSESLFRRYVTASATLGESQYGQWGTISSSSTCLTSSNLTGDNFLDLYNKTQDEKNTFLQKVKVSKFNDKEETTEPNGDSIASSSASQNSTRYLLYINGMETPYDIAVINKIWIQHRFLTAGANFTNMQLVYNANEWFIMDVVQAMKQYLNAPNNHEGWFKVVSDFLRASSYLPTEWISDDVIASIYGNIDWTSYRDGNDYTDTYDYVSLSLETGTSVIISHSQGNFFANEVWEQLNNENGKNISDRLRIIGLASPASYIPEDFLYFNNSQDKVLQAINENLPIKTLQYNMFKVSSDDPLGHGLKETYLPKNGSTTSVVIETAMQYFDEMENSDFFGNCEYTNFVMYSGGTHVFTPSEENFKGNINYEFNAYNDPNSIRLYYGNGNNLVTSNGLAITGFHSGSFYYDEAAMGALTLTIQGNDLWRFTACL